MDLTPGGDLKLWRTDGTVAGSYGIAILDLLSDFTVTGMTPVGGGEEILFQGFDPINGGEVWRSEGDLRQTTLLTNLRTGAASSAPQDFTRVGGNIVFSADDGDHVRELFSLPIESTGGWAMDPFGFSCPGTDGARPHILGGGEARLGGSIDLDLHDAKPLAPALLYISGIPAEFALPGGCVLYFAPPFQFLGVVGTDANGSGSFPLAVPDEAFLLGLPLYFQYFVVDPAGAYESQLALTEGLEVVIGPMD